MKLDICYAVSTSTIHFRKISLQINAVTNLFQFLKRKITPKNTKITEVLGIAPY